LTNMLLQMYFGMKFYSKSMRMGTLILICAVAELGEIGPKEPADIDPLVQLARPLAKVWTFFLVICTGITFALALKHFHDAQESWNKLCSFALVVSLTTVIGSSISKCFGLLSGGPLGLAYCLYFLDGLLCMFFTVQANQRCDVSLYIPAQLSTQLVINMFTGFFVWGDAAYIDRPVSYLLVYAIAIMGVYLISTDLDLVGYVLRRRLIRHSRLSENPAAGPLDVAWIALLKTWQRAATAGADVDEFVRDDCRETLDQSLLSGCEVGAISDRDLCRTHCWWRPW